MSTLNPFIVLGLSGLFGFLMIAPILLTEIRTAFPEENRLASRLYGAVLAVNLSALLVLAFFGTKLFPGSLDEFALLNLVTMVAGVVASFILLLILQRYIEHLYFTHEVENWLLYTVTLTATVLGWNLSYLF